MFELTPEQHAKLANWASRFPLKLTGANGGRFTYCFTPTSIGLVVKVIDNCTQEQVDLTKYDNW